MVGDNLELGGKLQLSTDIQTIVNVGIGDTFSRQLDQITNKLVMQLVRENIMHNQGNGTGIERSSGVIDVNTVASILSLG